MFGSSDPDREVCGATLERLDDFLGEVNERRGSDPGRVELYLVDDDSDYCMLQFDAGGCARPTEGVAFVDDLGSARHELVHLSRGSRHAQGFWDEGLSHAWGDGFSMRDGATPGALEALTRSIGELPLDNELRGAAGGFVAYLAREFGPNTMADFEAEIPWNASLATMNARSLDYFGESLEVLSTEFADSAACFETAFADPVVGCGAGPVDAICGESAALIQADTTCSSNRSEGPFVGYTFNHFVIDVPQDSHLSLDFDAAVTTRYAAGSVGFVQLRKCGGGCSELPGAAPHPVFEDGPEGGAEHVTEVDAGRHVVVIGRTSTDPGVVGLRVTCVGL